MENTKKLRSTLAALTAGSEDQLLKRFGEWLQKYSESRDTTLEAAVQVVMREMFSTLITSLRTGRYEEILVQLKNLPFDFQIEQVEAGLRAFRAILVRKANDSLEDPTSKHRAVELIYKDFDLILDSVSRLQDKMYALRLEKEIERKTAELLEAQDLYKGLVENSPIGVCILQDNQIKFANDEFARMGGYTKEEIIGMDYRQLLTPESLEEHKEGIERRQRGLDGPLTYRATALRKDGSPIEVEIHSVPTVFKGKPATQSTVRDISREKKIEQLRQSFFSNVSHELRTPLTTISGHIKFLLSGKKGKLDPSHRQFLEAASEETDKLDRIIDTILELASLDSKSFRLHLADVDMTRVTRKVANSKTPQAKQKDLTLEVSLPDGLSHIVGDERRLEMLMNNIVDNAIKFTPEGGEVRIEGRDEGSNVVIEISDTGIGIAKEEQSKIFDRFYQADSSPTRKYAGAGLGLSICKEIADLHGGRIEVESDVGKGSTFRILLPKEGRPE
ncbi:MAG: ATP-binding protein [Thermoplasmata archaeon]